MPDPKYASDEAVFLLNEYAEDIRPSTEAFHGEVEKLLVAFISLMKDGGFYADTGPESNEYEFKMANRVVIVGTRRDGIYVRDPDDEPSEAPLVPLIYDRATKVLRSREADTFHAPAPGQPIQHRSALAELLRASIATMKRQKAS